MKSTKNDAESGRRGTVGASVTQEKASKVRAENKINKWDPGAATEEEKPRKVNSTFISLFDSILIVCHDEAEK